MITGISAKLKDRRVDRILVKQGYEIADCKIFYSPVLLHYLYPLILILIVFSPAIIGLSQLLPFIFIIIAKIFSNFYFFILIYLTIQYLLCAYLNNTIIVTNDNLIIINPNFPFQSFQSFDFKLIKHIKLGENKLFFPFRLFWIFGSNYITITTDYCKKRYYCIYLEKDAYDENMTELNFDDLHRTLSNKNFSLEFDIKD